MTDKEMIKILQKELRSLESENTQLREKMSKPPSPLLQSEFEKLVFELKGLRAQVNRSEVQLREYQRRMRELIDSHYAVHKRRQPTSP